MSRPISHSDDELRRRFAKLADRQSVADLLEVPASKLTYHIYKSNVTTRYREFLLAKKSGGTRKILAPVSALKVIQRKLSFVLNLLYSPKPSVNGFVPARSIKSNAERHVGMEYVFNLDLKDFFPSINFGRVRGMFMKGPYNLPDGVATVLAQICCFDNQLPQGAPTSPIVSNMICAKLDSQLQALAKQYRCVYTRYADDITFSTSLSKFPKAIAHVVRTRTADELALGHDLAVIIEGNGFVVNDQKLRIRGPHQSQEVTGLTVNRVVNVKRRFVREIRAMLHAWEKFGLEAAGQVYIDLFATKQRLSNTYPPFREVVAGKLSFLSSVRGKDDPTYLKLMKHANRLDASFRLPPQSAAIRTNDDLLKAIWVLECEEDCKQGTAFMLGGFGLVTCHHVLGKATHAFQAADPARRYPVKILAADIDLDLAILDIDPKPTNYLEIGDSDSVDVFNQVTLLGFPNFNLGDTGLIKRGEVVGFRIRTGVRRIIISTSIVAGNSGGPLLDSKNRVVGVAATGAEDARQDDKTENHAAIPISALSNVLLQGNKG